MLAFDTPNDVLTYSLVDNAGGLFKVDAITGIITTTGTVDYEARASYAIVARATDSGGLTTQETFTIAVNDLDESAAVARFAMADDADDRSYAEVFGTTGRRNGTPDGTATTGWRTSRAGRAFARSTTSRSSRRTGARGGRLSPGRWRDRLDRPGGRSHDVALPQAGRPDHGI